MCQRSRSIVVMTLAVIMLNAKESTSPIPNILPQLHLLHSRYIHLFRFRHLHSTTPAALACAYGILPPVALFAPLTLNTLQQHTSWLIIRVLRYESPCKRLA